VASRLDTRVQLTTDGHQPYLLAVDRAFEGDIDYATIVKLYGARRREPRSGGSPSSPVRRRTAAVWRPREGELHSAATKQGDGW
jgi:hypothetical protein